MSQQHVGAMLSPSPPARGNPASTSLLCSLSRSETASCPPVQLLGLGGSDGAWPPPCCSRGLSLALLSLFFQCLWLRPWQHAARSRAYVVLSYVVLSCGHNFLEVMQDPIILQLLLLPFPGLQSIQPRAENKSAALLRLCLVLAFLSVEKTF